MAKKQDGHLAERGAMTVPSPGGVSIPSLIVLVRLVYIVTLYDTVDLTGREPAHDAPRGARARDFVNFRRGIHAARARGAHARV